jgi:hypothetical protein
VLTPSEDAYESGSSCAGIFEPPPPEPMINTFPATRIGQYTDDSGAIEVWVLGDGLPVSPSGVVASIEAKITHSWTYSGAPVGGSAGVFVEVRLLDAFGSIFYLGWPANRQDYLNDNHTGEETIVAPEAYNAVGRNLNELGGAIYVYIRVGIAGDSVVFPAYVLDALSFKVNLEP